MYPGQLATGLCPAQTFAGDDIYLKGEGVSAEEQAERIAIYWQPYHDEITAQLGRLRAEFGFALLWDAHSIPGVVPRLFDGELPELNIGTFDETSCAAHIANPALRVAENSSFSVVMNGRFKGGYITRNYGDPERNVHAVQLEISQRSYMNEDTRLYSPDKAETLRATLTSMLQAYLDAAERHYQ
jgi:N-formylglutamate amidohydrolase